MSKSNATFAGVALAFATATTQAAPYPDTPIRTGVADVLSIPDVSSHDKRGNPTTVSYETTMPSHFRGQYIVSTIRYPGGATLAEVIPCDNKMLTGLYNESIDNKYMASRAQDPIVRDSDAIVLTAASQMYHACAFK